jgi:hypothetical protein
MKNQVLLFTHELLLLQKKKHYVSYFKRSLPRNKLVKNE